MDILADIGLATEPEPTKPKKWYQRHDAGGWAPEADDVTLAPRSLATCNTNQVPSIVYAPAVEVDPELIGAKLYYPGFGALWGYRGTFEGHGGARYYEVEALGTVDGCGIAVGSVWAAEAGKFRRVA